MDEPNWALVLAVLYREESEVTAPRDLHQMSNSNTLVETTGLNATSVADSLIFLRDQGLVEMPSRQLQTADDTQKYEKKIEITTKGFDVAHERELSLRSNASNYAIAILTAILGLTAILELAIAFATENLRGWSLYLIGATIIVTMLLLVWVWRQLDRAGAVNIQGLIERQRRFD